MKTDFAPTAKARSKGKHPSKRQRARKQRMLAEQEALYRRRRRPVVVDDSGNGTLASKG